MNREDQELPFYDTHQFAGQTRYHCPECSFDHYDPLVVEEHVGASHRSTVPTGSGMPTLFDASGQEIVRESDE